MSDLVGIIFGLMDWRFLAGLAVGALITFRYIATSIYHPIIRQQDAENAILKSEIDAKKPD